MWFERMRPQQARPLLFFNQLPRCKLCCFRQYKLFKFSARHHFRNEVPYPLPAFGRLSCNAGRPVDVASPGNPLKLVSNHVVLLRALFRDYCIDRAAKRARIAAHPGFYKIYQQIAPRHRRSLLPPAATAIRQLGIGHLDPNRTESTQNRRPNVFATIGAQQRDLPTNGFRDHDLKRHLFSTARSGASGPASILYGSLHGCHDDFCLDSSSNLEIMIS
jgi:hypothetical protein